MTTLDQLSTISNYIERYDCEFGRLNLYSGFLRKLEINLVLSKVLLNEISSNILLMKLSNYDQLHFLDLKLNRKQSEFELNPSNDSVYCFAKEEFYKKYGSEITEFTPSLKTAEDLRHLEPDPLARYLYIISTEGELFWSSKQVDVKRILKGKTPGDHSLVHPMLAINCGLKVKIAGEFSLISTLDRNKSALYIDNMSGHFKPYQYTNHNISEIAKSQFLPRLQNIKHLLTFSFLGGHQYEKI